MLERLEFNRIFSLRRKVVIEVPEIAYESDSGILIEWNRQNAWLLKRKIKIERKNGTILLEVPKWLFDRKFS